MHQAFLRFCVFLRSLQHSEDGQDMVEYSLLVSLIALTLIASLQQLATALVTFFSNVSTSLA
ncbi:MAG: Flp family type IVb pilin [Terracidiphilus sp.]|jgi:Flp pilus assembly pilin Flp